MQYHRPLPNGNAAMSMCYTSAGESATWLGRRPKGQAAPKKTSEEAPASPLRPAAPEDLPSRIHITLRSDIDSRHRHEAPKRNASAGRHAQTPRAGKTKRSVVIKEPRLLSAAEPIGPHDARHPRLAQPHPNPDPNTAKTRAAAKPGGKWL